MFTLTVDIEAVDIEAVDIEAVDIEAIDAPDMICILVSTTF